MIKYFASYTYQTLGYILNIKNMTIKNITIGFGTPTLSYIKKKRNGIYLPGDAIIFQCLRLWLESSILFLLLFGSHRHAPE